VETEAIDNLAKAFDDKGADAQVGREAEVTKLHAKRSANSSSSGIFWFATTQNRK
jgi:hypothetical protein